jgi:threonyl-tRNA synthetase
MKVKYAGKEFEIADGANGFDAAKVVDPEKKNKALAYKIGEKIFDMREPLQKDAEFAYVMPEDPDGFEMLNHSCSHLMAQAIKHLYPKALFGFGPAIEEGFYYDIDFGDQVVTEADFPKIEAEMKKLSKDNIPFKRREISMDEALEVFKDNHYKVEHIKELQAPISIYEARRFHRFLPRPARSVHRLIKHFKTFERSRRLLAWRLEE